MKEKEFKKFIRTNYYDRPSYIMYLAILTLVIIVVAAFFILTSEQGIDISSDIGINMYKIADMNEADAALSEIRDGIDYTADILDELDAIAQETGTI